jgi:serine/threonine protein kinase/tetratricopeptide (TPR) repeat protein
MADGIAPRELAPGDRIGRYTVTRQLGRGGMGVVYVARDERLDRDVALKMIAGLPDDTARTRFWREARAAASVNHPHICQVFEVDDSQDGLFLTMELLEGEPLDRRLLRGALGPQEAVPIAIGVLSALSALHARGLLHRDVKPSNVFVTPHGPKLLDFGLARPALTGAVALDASATTPVTEAGMIIGTPHYMAPEQVTGGRLDGRTDLYAVGAVIFQMLAGRPPFTGSATDILFAALKEHPPALQGPPAVVAIDRVIRRAMRKDPADRYAAAGQMAADLSAVPLAGTTHGMAVPVRALTRIIVPPVRMTRTDPDVAFLSFGLAEAVSGSLAALGDVVVRAPALAARWSDQATDPRRLAAEADVDLVISSTLLRSGQQLRITAQLLDASSSTLLGSTTVKGSMDDIFAVEDALTRQVVALLSSQLTGGVPQAAAPARRDVPANPRVFELFLRGMEHMRQLSQTVEARDLFEQAVAEDPRFAPAWAALGRCHRVYGKYFQDREANDRRADEAFHRALELSPDLPIAHHYLTHFEAERGHADRAIARLLRHARTNRNDAQSFAGLVHACRYAGLIDASLAAHDEALRLDPNVKTGVEYTLAHLVDGAEEAVRRAMRHGSNSLDLHFVLGVFGDPAAARQALQTIDIDQIPPAFRLSVQAIAASLLRPADEAMPIIEQAMAAHVDPEALFGFGMILVRIGAVDRGLDVLAGAVHAGYSPVSTLAAHRSLDAVRAQPLFIAIEEEARRRVQSARAVFDREGGPELLGMPPATRLYPA